MSERMKIGPDTICKHCAMRRARHVRRHHGRGPRGTEWYCRTPMERIFEPSPHWTEEPDLSVAALENQKDAVVKALADALEGTGYVDRGEWHTEICHELGEHGGRCANAVDALRLAGRLP